MVKQISTFHEDEASV